MSVTLRLKSIDKNQEHRVFSCYLDSIDQSFQTIDNIVSAGSILLQACILMDDHRVELPIAAFDGQTSFTEALNVLKEEWESVLTKPTYPVKTSNTASINLLTGQIQILENRVMLHQQMIHQIDALIQSAQQNMFPGHTRSQYLIRCQGMIATRQAQIERMQFKRNLVTARIRQLTTAKHS